MLRRFFGRVLRWLNEFVKKRRGKKGEDLGNLEEGKEEKTTCDLFYQVTLFPRQKIKFTKEKRKIPQ